MNARAATRVVNVYASHRYAFLFYTLIVTLAAAPLLSAFHLSGDLLQMLVAFSLLVAILGVPGHAWRMLLVLITAVTVGLLVVPASAIGEGVATGGLVAAGAFALVAAATAIRFALSARVIESEQIYAALSAYVLAGLFFGVLHWIVASMWPGSFAQAGVDASAGLSLTTAIYYSFVTLATLGYGDVVPRTDVARSLAVLEAVAGQFYIAVTIARLVGAGLRTPG